MGEGLRLHIALRFPLQGIIANSGGSAEASFDIAGFQNALRIMGTLGPWPGQAIRLQFNAHLQLIRGALIHTAVQAFHLFQHAQFILDVMPNLMRHNTGRSEIARCPKLAQQTPHDIQIDANALIGGAIKRPHLRLTRTATRTGRAAI